jgi:hypothetical protein
MPANFPLKCATALLKILLRPGCPPDVIMGFSEYLQTGQEIPDGLSSHGMGAFFIMD